MGTQRYIDMTFDLSYPTEHPKFLQRLGESTPTDIVVQVKNKGVSYSLAGVNIGFEMRSDKDKILVDTDQSRFTIVSSAQGVFSYRPPKQMQSFFGNSYLAYFTFESGGTRITTERFRYYNDEDVQLAIAPELQEHYVSVIDDLITSNSGAMEKAEEIKRLIESNQVVKKAGDTMTGTLSMAGSSAISQKFKAGTGAQVGWESLTDGTFRMYDWTNSRNVLSYNPATDYVSLNRKHPYVTKTGDTMTGNLSFDSPNAVGLSFKNGDKNGISMNHKWNAGGTTAEWYLYNWETNQIDASLTTNNGFIVNAKTNLLKKSGDTMTGDMVMDPGKSVQFKSNGSTSNTYVLRGQGGQNKLVLSDTTTNKFIWDYSSDSDTFTVTSNTNLLKKTGDTMTGNLNFASAGQIQNVSATGQLLFGNSGIWINDTNGNFVPWQYRYSDKMFIVNAETNLMKKVDYSGKDGRADLVMTADASNSDTSRKPISIRRGNTVTIRGAIQLNSSSTGIIVTTLPTNYRPTDLITQVYTALDGTSHIVNIYPTGVVEFNSSSKGKTLYIATTYVVD